MSATAIVRARATSIPAWAWVGAVVVVSAAIRVALAPRIVAPWIMVDELVYSELAKSFASHGSFLVRGEPSSGYGFVYPVLIAPAFRLFAAVPDAYAAAKAINAVVMSLVAVPTYLLARRLLPPLQSVAAAALAVLVPSMLYTGTLMTENAFYPLFVLTCLAFVWMLERPTALRQLAALAACGLCFATRAQAVALLAALIVAPVLHGAIERDVRARLRRFVPLYSVLSGLLVLALAVTIGRGRSPLALLGAYRAATGSGYSIGEVARYVLWHAAEIDLYLGIVGFAALLALWFAPRAASAPARAFAAATLPTCVFLIVEVGAFASRQSFRVEERNGFYIAPLALIALLGLTVDGVVPRVRRAVVAAALVAGVLPFAIPLGRLVNTSIVSDTLALLPWWWLQDRGISFASLRYVELLVGLAAGAAFLLVPRRLAFVFVAATAVYFVAVTFVAENGRHGMHQASVGGLWAGTRVANYDWIDRRVGRTARVAFLWHYAGETRPLWNNEFFNRSIGRVYTVDGPDPADGGLPEVPVRERADGVLATGTGAVPRVSYAVSYTDIAGRQIGRDPRIGLGLYRVDGPLVILTRVRGLFADDTWGRREVTYRRLRCLPGTLAVRLGTDSQLFDRAQVVTAREGGAVVGRARVEPTAQPTMRVPLRPGRGGTCTVLFTAAGVRVPARVQPGSKDARPLAVHYYAFDYARR